MVIFCQNVNHINEFMMDSFNESINEYVHLNMFEYVQILSVLIPKAVNISRYNPQKQKDFGILKKC